MLQQGIEPNHISFLKMHQLFDSKDELFFELFKLLFQYGFQMKTLESYFLENDHHILVEETNTDKIVWLLQRGFDPNFIVFQKPFLFSFFDFNGFFPSFVKDEDLQELVYWLLLSGAKLTNEKECFLTEMEKHEAFFLLETIAHFQDIFEEKTMKKFHTLRFKSLYT